MLFSSRVDYSPNSNKQSIKSKVTEIDENTCSFRTYNSLLSLYTPEYVEYLNNPKHFGLAIHQNDHQARRRFVEWAQNEIAVVPDFHKRILFSDEAHFWLDGYVNKQNCRIWSEANSQVYVETPLHPEKLTVLVRFMGWWNPSSKTMKATMLQSMVIGIEP
ncbi:uncharacterized protein TNCV_714231 [Trichonephila clavipes]|nr:uncharacterized protein TNCV_714231 [Trichonephila clavipes]